METLNWLQIRPSSQLMVIGGEATMSDSSSVCQLVSERPQRARVFEKWGLPYCCCGGKVPLAKACSDRNIDLEAVLRDLSESDSHNLPDLHPECKRDWKAASISDLVDHILNVHHAPLRQELSRLSYLVDRVANDHGATFNELWEMQGLFEELKEQIIAQMDAEETDLFPLLKRMANPSSGLHATGDASRPLMSERVRLLQRLCGHNLEHADLRHQLQKLREWTHGFMPPETACNTYRVLLVGLNELNLELQRHMMEEETLLFPRVVALESATSGTQPDQTAALPSPSFSQ